MTLAHHLATVEGLEKVKMLRRRSGDAALSENMPGDTPQQATSGRRKPSRTAFVFITIISTLAITLVILARFHQDWTPQGLDLPANGETDVNDAFALHPTEHAQRPPTTVVQRWRITSGMRRPDGVSKRVYLINDEFPGPILELRSGDRLVVKVENALDDEGLSFHWHGLSMRAANEMDGAVGVTQSPIEPHEVRTYDFEIEAHQHGTFWYHAHDGVQRADGLFGGLIVHEPSQNGAKLEATVEKLLLVGDWYHRTAEDALNYYMHPGSFGNEPIPDSMLLNGQGTYNCNDAVPARPLDCEQRRMDNVSTLRLDGGKSNVLRLVNVGAYAGISVTVAGSVLTPLAVDGGNQVFGTQSVSVGYLQPGERVDFLVQSARKHTESAYLEISLDTSPFKISNSALTPTRQYPLRWENAPVTPAKIEGKTGHFDLEDLKPKEDQSALLPEKADHTIVLYAMTQKLSHLDNIPHGFINNTFWTPQAKPLNTIHREEWDDNQLVPHISYNPEEPFWVDIVLNNLDEEGHPFHLHGYDFWVLSKYSSSFNWGSYNPFGTQDPPGGPYSLANALRKDTIYVPRRGYAVLRIKADNPGLWLFHCHVLWHQASGMAMSFDVSG